MLKFIICFSFFSVLNGEANTDVIDQAQKWHNIQQQLVVLYDQHEKLSSNKHLDNQEFFSMQQQLGAIYLAQKRYQLGFGTALLPSEKAIHNYVRKKTFLKLKTKEILPLYKKSVQEYQKKYSTGELERVQKFIKQLEALNLLHIRLFEQLEHEQGKKPGANISKINDIPSIKACVEKLPIDGTNKKFNHLLNWITPVAGSRSDFSKAIWKPLAGAIVLCPDIGTVTLIGYLDGRIAVFIKQHRFTYIITGLSKCCVSVGSKLSQGEPIGFCSDKDPCPVELQLWRDDIALDPNPYHKVLQL